jgi:hypothetical protein
VPAQISALPTPPTANDPTNFNSRADTFLAALPAFATQANTVANEIAASAQSASNFASTASAKAAEATGQASQAAASAASALSAPGTNGTSATSLTIGAGAKTFTTQTGKAWIAGQGFFLASSASPVNWMTGVLTAYNASTGAATLQVDTIGGAGTFAAWNCGLAAGRSLPMASQAQAEAGTDNASLTSPLTTAQAIAAQAFPVGSLIETAATLGARWLPCTGLNYLNSAYPSLTSLMPAYINPMTLRLSGNISKIVYGGGVFVAWVYNGSIYNLYTSTDGVTWTSRTNPLGATSSATPTACAYGNGMFVAAKTGALYSSPDGVSWTAKTNPFGVSDAINAIAFGGGTWLTVGYVSGVGGRGYTSTDLMNWTQRSLPGSSIGAQSIAYSSTLSRWVVGLYDGNANYSDNAGVSWTNYNVAPASGTYVNSIVWGNGRFVAVLSNGSVWYSSTGDSAFTEAPTGTAMLAGSYPYQVIHDGARFIVCGDKGVLGQSADGMTAWVALASGVGAAPIYSVARVDPAITTPLVIAASSAGVRSGLDQSTTQFVVPTVTARSPLLPPYIKAS